MSALFRTVARRAGTIGAQFMLARYLLASICALSLDMALFLGLSRAGLPNAIAATGGYGAGLLLHWVISTRFVFACDRPSHTQRLAFVASAAVGLLVTIIIIEFLSRLGLGQAISKLFAIPVSFGAVYAIRKYGVFGTA
ncbi:GtrA family protein [Sphingobium sp. YR768]|uniref:GtrA family protein n=1 Tax=Sphingobium sp. YR768 TaxID=1884365 RepID=UPI0008C91A26|nr:GtrA family protein [Sphingobium sp. YR768]SER74292.1 GtrA-like protein [Sphingobium sp. YR768]